MEMTIANFRDREWPSRMVLCIFIGHLVEEHRLELSCSRKLVHGFLDHKPDVSKCSDLQASLGTPYGT